MTTAPTPARARIYGLRIGAVIFAVSLIPLTIVLAASIIESITTHQVLTIVPFAAFVWCFNVDLIISMWLLPRPRSVVVWLLLAPIGAVIPALIGAGLIFWLLTVLVGT